MGPWWGLASLSIVALSRRACVEDGHKRLHVWSLTWTATSRRICVNLVVLDFTSETMAQNSGRILAQDSLRQPHPHSVDLLRNCDPTNPLGPFDGNVGVFAQLGAQHYFITTNADYVPAVPSLKIPHAVYLRSDMRYGTDDPTLWPQQ
ncbi:hypothetical protein B0H10DRAFT_1957442 [Mycena sp. CBHHK59/15]|nr:hypothetical protein B0H10DRAFT_1957442 [Mycena sp. CBHHK59/15]